MVFTQHSPEDRLGCIPLWPALEIGGQQIVFPSEPSRAEAVKAFQREVRAALQNNIPDQVDIRWIPTAAAFLCRGIWRDKDVRAFVEKNLPLWGWIED